MIPRVLAAGVVRARTMKMKKKKKKGRQPKYLFGRCPEERRRFIPVAPHVARQQDLDVNQEDKTTTPPITCVGEAFKGLRVGGKGKEDIQTGRGDGNGVHRVARWIACRPSEPIEAHNLERETNDHGSDDRLADNIA